MKIKEKYGKVTLISGFVFKSVFSGEKELCRNLVEVTTGLHVADVQDAQHEYEIDPHPEHRAGILDLLVTDERDNRYDIEVQAANQKDVIWRARHYQASWTSPNSRKVRRPRT